MTLPRGTRVGVYEIVAPLGAGGMGEVYRARDPRLQRDVAIKILPDAVAADHRRLARFEREARTLATLNHPHIAHVYGFEDSVATEPGAPARPALIMELVDGENLAERIARGPLSVSDTMQFARQIADGLEGAHEAGIIHRDLKPSNIKVRPDGTVKVLDFGIARNERIDEPGAPSTTETMTLPGEFVGTAAYMSPEQARGLPADRRTDIWAFGCVLFEMLTARRAFHAPTQADTIAAVLQSEPDFSLLPANLPSAVRHLLRRCLARDRKERLRDIADAQHVLEDAQRGHTEMSPPPHSARDWRLPALVCLVGGIVLGALTWDALNSRAPAGQSVVRFELTASTGGRRVGLAVSADGARLVYASTEGFVVHSRDRLEPIVLQGLGTFPGIPFFSPDGEWIAYADSPLLKKVSVTGGAPVVIAETGPGTSGDWAPEGIVLADVRGLFKISSEGGTHEPIEVTIDGTEQASAPEILPGGRAVLYTVLPTRSILGMTSTVHAAGARIEVADIETGARKVLIRGASAGRFVPTGHLIYLSGGTLHAIRFDQNALEVRGNPVEIVRDPVAEFAVSNEGTLVYTKAMPGEGSTLVWVDRHGREEPLGAPPRSYLYPRLSPDGTRVALDVLSAVDRDIWMWDLRRKTLERFTVDNAGNPLVAWSPDGKRVAYGSDRFGPTNLFIQAADGGGDAERLLVSERIQMPLGFTPDGRLLFSEEVQGQGRNVHALTLDGSGRVTPLIATAANELNAEISPDAEWLAYDSNESGQFEIYVRPYPNVGERRWKISLQGGRQPLWSRNGRELYYRDFSGAVMAVAVTSTPAFAAGEVTKLFEGPYVGGSALGSARTYDLSLDGTRFLMIKSGASSNSASGIIVVLHWFDELKRLVATD